MFFFFFFQAEDGIRDYKVTGVQTCALPICAARPIILAIIDGITSMSGGEGPWCGGAAQLKFTSPGAVDRESVGEGKSGDLGGRRIIKKKKRIVQVSRAHHDVRITRRGQERD